MLIERRGLLTGIVATLCAPSIVRAESLMRIAGERYRVWGFSCPLLPPAEAAYNPALWDKYLGPTRRLQFGTWTFFGKTGNIYTDNVIDFVKREYPDALPWSKHQTQDVGLCV